MQSFVLHNGNTYRTQSLLKLQTPNHSLHELKLLNLKLLEQNNLKLKTCLDQIKSCLYQQQTPNQQTTLKSSIPHLFQPFLGHLPSFAEDSLHIRIVIPGPWVPREVLLEIHR